MDPRNLEKQRESEEPRYLDFRHLPDGTTRDGKPALNKFSSTLTNDHDFPGAQVGISIDYIDMTSSLHPASLHRPCSTQQAYPPKKQ